MDKVWSGGYGLGSQTNTRTPEFGIAGVFTAGITTTALVNYYENQQEITQLETSYTPQIFRIYTDFGVYFFTLGVIN